MLELSSHELHYISGGDNAPMIYGSVPAMLIHGFFGVLASSIGVVIVGGFAASCFSLPYVYSWYVGDHT